MIDFLHNEANTIGIIGVIIVLFAYLMLQMGYFSQRHISFSLLNTVGSVLILESLMFYWNLASVVIEVSWLIISLYGLTKACWLRWGRGPRRGTQ